MPRGTDGVAASEREPAALFLAQKPYIRGIMAHVAATKLPAPGRLRGAVVAARTRRNASRARRRWEAKSRTAPAHAKVLYEPRHLRHRSFRGRRRGAAGGHAWSEAQSRAAGRRSALPFRGQAPRRPRRGCRLDGPSRRRLCGAPCSQAPRGRCSGPGSEGCTFPGHAAERNRGYRRRLLPAARRHRSAPGQTCR